jgi:hypothetical protein
MGTFFPMTDDPNARNSVTEGAARLATLLTGGETGVRDPSGSDLEFEPSLVIRPLKRRGAPPEVWAVDGGQALVADAKCVQLYVTRTARVRWAAGRCVLEEEGELRAHVLGLGQSRKALASSGAPAPADSAVDVNLLRDWGEWEAVAGCVGESPAGSMVLVDGDLQPDWRIPSTWLGSLLATAAERGVTIAGVTKHTSLSWGSAPLLGVLEARAADELGPRACWWAPVARTRGDVGAGIHVLVARMDPDARYAFRVDVPAGSEAESVLGSLSALCDDAAFPGYPYPLSVADRIAACTPAVRDDALARVFEVFDEQGVPVEVRERALEDRHRYMERY